MKKSTRILLGAAAALAAAAVGGATWLNSRAQAAVEVYGQPVTRGPLQAFVKATAIVQPLSEYTLAAPVSGRLALQSLQVGQLVRRAQVLARFDAADAEQRLRVAEAGLRGAELQEDKARRNHRAEKTLWEAGGQSWQAVEEAQATLQLEQSRRDRARAELNAARVQHAQLDVTAPADGLVTSIEAHQGEFVPAGAPLLHLAAHDELQLQLKVDQGVADAVRLGQTVELLAESSAVLGRSRISRLEPKIQKEGSTYFLVAWAPLRGSGVQARHNQQFAARILTASREQVLRVPLDLLTEKDGVEAVRVIDHGRLRLQPVKTGIQDGRHVELLDGVSDGQLVLQSNARQPLREGMAVRLATAAPSP